MGRKGEVMAKHETWKCDSCGKIKGEANHWWVAYESCENGKFWFAFARMTGVPLADWKTLCSSACLQSEIRKFEESEAVR